MSKKTSTPDPKPLGTLERDLLEAGYKALVANPLNGWFKPVYPGQAGHLKIAGLLEKRDGGEFRLTEKGAEAMGKPYPVPGMKHQPGDGLPPNADIEKCPNCNGTGKLSDFTDGKPRTCRVCDGSGLMPPADEDFVPESARAYRAPDAGPVIPEPPVDSQDVQLVKTISDSELNVTNERSNALADVNAQLLKEIADLNRRLAEEEPKRQEAWAQVESLKAELNSARKANEVLSEQLADVQTKLSFQAQMLREAVPAAQGKVEMDFFQMPVPEIPNKESVMRRNELDTLLAQGWNIAREQWELGVWHARLTRPVQPKPAGGDEARQAAEALKRQGLSGPHQAEPFVKAVGHPMTIIGVDPGVPEQSRNLAADIMTRGADAVLADMDAQAMAAGEIEYQRAQDWLTGAKAFPLFGGGS